MKNTKLFAASLAVLLSFAACGGSKNTELAAQAMERARAAEAPKYAPTEFAKADKLYKQMTEAVNAKNNKEASALADQTVMAANEAVARALENKAIQLIDELGVLLDEAQKQGLPQSHGQAYNQAAQSHIDASSFRDAGDFEKAIQAAEMGLSIIRPLVGKSEAEARNLLEKARSRYEAVSAADQNKGEALDNAKQEIDLAAEAFNKKDYETTKKHAQNALDILGELTGVSTGPQPLANDSLQLQSYQLLRQLENTINYLKKNGYTNDVFLNQTNDTVPAAPVQVSETPEAPVEDEIFIFMEEDAEPAEPVEDALSYLPTLYRAQAADSEVITLRMIEEKYSQAQTAYDEGNYINAIDSTREGLRLADLYLAGQTIGSHKVVRGNTLWGIAGAYYNKRYLLWPHIWTANKFKIKDPDLIYPNQTFRIPPVPQVSR